MPALRPRRPLTVLSLTLALALAAPARADRVVLQDGAVREGRIVEEGRSHVVLETEIGRIRISRDDIRDLVKEAPPAPERGETGDADEDASARADEATDGSSAEELAADSHDEAAELKAAMDALAAADRLASRRRSRSMRRTQPLRTARNPGGGASASEGTSGTDTPHDEAASSLARRDLGALAKGTRIAVFEAPRPVEGMPGAIELGPRSCVEIELVGVHTAVLRAPGGESRSYRLDAVRRAVQIETDLDRRQLFDGVEDGDWLRVTTTDGEVRVGRFGGVSGTRAMLATVHEDGSTDQVVVHTSKVDAVSGLLQSQQVSNGLDDLVEGEPVAIVTWPELERTVGTFVPVPGRVVALDTDGDGKPDARFAKRAAIAELRRVPPLLRDVAVAVRPGDVVNVNSAEVFEDAIVRHTRIARLAAVTALGVTLADDEGVTIVPFDEIRRFSLVADDPDGTLRDANRRLEPDAFESSAPLLPGQPSELAEEIEPSSGVRVVAVGESVSHVFYSPPYEGSVFGVRLGKPATTAARESALTFGTVVQPRSGGSRALSELHSSSVEGVHITLLVDVAGTVTAIELTRDDPSRD